METNTQVIELTPPGQILLEEFLQPSGITPYRLSECLGVPQMYISKVINTGRIGPQVAAMLDTFFGLSHGYFSRLQADYDDRIARRKYASKLKKIKTFEQLQQNQAA